MTPFNLLEQETSLARYADVISLDVYPCYLLTKQGTVVFSNNVGDRICPGDRLQQCLLQDSSNEQLFLEGSRSTNPHIGRLRLLDDEGNPFTVRARIARLPERTQTPMILVRLDPGDVQDQFQRLRAESSQLQRAVRARKRSDNRFRQFLNSAVDGIGSVDSAGRITMANSALSQMLGVSNLIGKYLFSYIDMGVAQRGFEDPEDPSAQLENIAGAPLEVYVESVGRDRTPVEITVTSIDDIGTRQYMVVMRDITARKEYHDALDRSQYLEAARDIARANEQSKTQFLATVSHEMRTPIGAISTAIDLLLQDRTLKPEQRQLMELIRGSSDTALEQINNTLEHVRMDMRPIKDHPVAVFSPRDLLERLAGQSRLAAEAKGLALHMDLNCVGDPMIAGHHHLFHRVVQNLLSNAVKYTDKGKIVLTANCTEIPHGNRQNQLAIELLIADTGRGIAAEEIDRLFAPFETGDSSFSSLAQSAGLGLSIVKRAVDAMGGSIRVSSTLGQGTEFKVSLRFGLPDTQRENALPVGQLPSKYLKGCRFLVVDDNPLNRELMSKLLDSEGCIPILADSGETALKMMQEQEVDAVLMDIGMPGIDGLEATRRLLSMKRHKDIPIFGLTGFSDRETRERAELAGMKRVYVKPLRRHQLYEIVERIYDFDDTPPAPVFLPPVTHILNKDVSRQISRIAGANWSVFVHQLHKECLTTLRNMRVASSSGAMEDIVDMARKAGTSAKTVGATSLNQSFLEIEERAQANAGQDLQQALGAAEKVLEETRLALTLL